MKRTTKECENCQTEVSLSNYDRHLSSKQCIKNQSKLKNITKIDPSWLQENGMYICPHCEKEYTKNGIGTHIWRNHGDGKDWTGNNDGYKDGRTIWSKGLTAESNEILAQIKNTILEGYYSGRLIRHNKGINLSDASKNKISIGMKKAHAEGRAHNIGKSR